MKPILDISEFQQGINYAEAAKDISGVIIRCGGTGYGEAHSVYDDSMFETHYQGFHNQGIPIGVYFYAGAVTDAGVDAELQLTKALLQGKDITLPVYYDVEVPQGDYLNLDVQERTRLIRRYMEGIDKLGYIGGLYTYLFYRSRLDLNKLSDHPVWMAQYYNRLEYGGKCELWQYTSGGEIRGYNGRVDLSEIMDGSWYNNLVNNGAVVPDPEPAPEPEQTDRSTVNMDMPVLGIGDEGKAVESLQHLLQGNGYSLTYCGGADGIFGEGTEYAVEGYQRANGLDVDGVVGRQTWGSLFPV